VKVEFFWQVELGCHGLAPWASRSRLERNSRGTFWGDATALCRGVSRSLLEGKSCWNFLGMPRPCAVEVHARCYKTNPQNFLEMPRPCAVEPHACRYKTNPQNFLGCYGLAPWSLTLAATKKKPRNFLGDATALRRGGLTLAARKKKPRKFSGGCHGLAPWSLTLAARRKQPRKFVGDATALRRGASRSLLQKKETPETFWGDATALRRGLTLATTNAHSLRKTPPLLDVLTNLRASQITVAVDIETRLPEAFDPRRNQRSANLFLRRVHQLNRDIGR